MIKNPNKSHHKSHKMLFYNPCYLWLQCGSQEAIPVDTMAVLGSEYPALWLAKCQTSLTCHFLGAFWHLESGKWQVPHCFSGVPPLESQIQILLCSGMLRKRMSVLSKVPMPCSSLPIMPPKYQFPHHSSVSEGFSGCLQSLINFYASFKVL